MPVPDIYKQGPVLRGDVYCSPWCGFKCKRSDFDQATKEADELAIRMGEGWVPNVWENMGWHYSVSKGAARITVREHVCTCWIDIIPQVIEDAKTPELALSLAIQKAHAHIRKSLAAIDTVIWDVKA